MESTHLLSPVIRSTLFGLSFMAFFVAGGVFAANVEIPRVIDLVGGVCFFGWWIPALAALCLRTPIRRLKIDRGFATATIIGCALTILGSAIFFTACLMLTSGPVSSEAESFGNSCLRVWWIPTVVGIVLTMSAIVCGLAMKESDPP